jgi:hypothetical protein
MLPLSFCGAAMSEQRPSKEMDSPLTVAMQTLELAKQDDIDPDGSPCWLEANQATALWEEIDRLQFLESEYATFRKCAAADVERLTEALRQLEDQLRRALDVDRAAHEPESAPVAWQYRVNGVHVFYTECEPPPGDAHDEGTLQPLYARPAKPPGDVG